MERPRRFEDLIAWQKARAMTREVYAASRRGEFGRDYGLGGQMQRAAVSVMSNIAEGFERRSAVDYQRFPGLRKRLAAKYARNSMSPTMLATSTKPRSTSLQHWPKKSRASSAA